jgi:hypothetical protein
MHPVPPIYLPAWTTCAPRGAQITLMKEGFLLGIRGDALKKLKLLQNSAGALCYGAQRLIGYVHRQAGFFCNQPIYAAQQRPSTCHHNSPIHQVGG